jgi:P pilus assembly chaperone PapD
MKGQRHALAAAVAWLVVMVVTSGQLGASVLVAPTVVFLNKAEPTERMTIMNQGTEPQEVTIDFAWGLPESDSVGRVYVDLQDSSANDPRSAMEWLRAFPRSMILPPGQSQIVRVMARPPAGLEDGEYWARVVVRSQKARGNEDSNLDEGVITTQLNMVMQTAIMVKYRTGELNSSLQLNSARAEKSGSKVNVIVDLESRGNVSYMGVTDLTLIDGRDREVASQSTNLAVYRDLRRRYQMNIPEDSRPPYRVRMRISSEGRTDIAPPDMIAGNSIEDMLAVE